MLSEFRITSGSAQLYGVKGGDGPALVFLHAGVADRRMYQAQLAEFAASHNVIAYDRRGFGNTTTTNEAFKHTSDLLALLEALGIRSAILCGCSQGARIAIDYTLQHPEQVSALILIGATFSGASWEESSSHERALAQKVEIAEQQGDIEALNELEAQCWLDGPGAKTGRLGGELRSLFLDMNGIALRAPELSNEIESPSAQPRLSEIGCPTLLVGGDLDFQQVHRQHDILEAKLTQVTRLHLMESAHLPSFEQPELFNSHLRRFLDSI